MVQKGCSSIYKVLSPRYPYRLNYTLFEPISYLTISTLSYNLVGKKGLLCLLLISFISQPPRGLKGRGTADRQCGGRIQFDIIGHDLFAIHFFILIAVFNYNPSLPFSMNVLKGHFIQPLPMTVLYGHYQWHFHTVVTNGCFIRMCLTAIFNSCLQRLYPTAVSDSRI